ncbi:hypothetical protein FIBSPDRAFT_901026 [Athelia psychrophila]|uniref:Uncharacterized protein n=1 Tax=Athelia psychrophila TaxID=1759441 RepID=A0A167VV57_9AGAM|nr:hypothetical protein FIBSPDRAFT_903525 [Fibularhizoctonia sp. CBS 109695]KZP08702.1 hypothetical protein FIBSPDRAFT_901026 [Fibularhizoctonia sp. CBS 109695]
MSGTRKVATSIEWSGIPDAVKSAWIVLYRPGEQSKRIAHVARPRFQTADHHRRQRHIPTHIESSAPSRRSSSLPAAVPAYLYGCSTFKDDVWVGAGEWVRRELQAGWGSHMGLGAHMSGVARFGAVVGTRKVGCGYTDRERAWEAHGLGSAYGVSIGDRARAWEMGTYTYGQGAGMRSGRRAG